jgi:hypothetical protein
VWSFILGTRLLLPRPGNTRRIQQLEEQINDRINQPRARCLIILSSYHSRWHCAPSRPLPCISERASAGEKGTEEDRIVEFEVKGQKESANALGKHWRISCRRLSCSETPPELQAAFGPEEASPAPITAVLMGSMKGRSWPLFLRAPAHCHLTKVVHGAVPLYPGVPKASLLDAA